MYNRTWSLWHLFCGATVNNKQSDSNTEGFNQWPSCHSSNYCCEQPWKRVSHQTGSSVWGYIIGSQLQGKWCSKVACHQQTRFLVGLASIIITLTWCTVPKLRRNPSRVSMLLQQSNLTLLWYPWILITSHAILYVFLPCMCFLFCVYIIIRTCDLCYMYC